MAETSSRDQQAAWAADLENQVQALREACASSGGADSPGEWFAGVLERGLAATTADIAGYEADKPTAAAPTHDSVFWCESRFVCISMHCGGSSWC